jgi:hypothetical protein
VQIPHIRLDDLSGFDASVFQGIANRDENGLITAYKCQKRSTIGDEGFRLNPVELLPEKTGEIRHFGIVQSEASIIVYKGPPSTNE